jgi:hypothetical protein
VCRQAGRRVSGGQDGAAEDFELRNGDSSIGSRGDSAAMPFQYLPTCKGGREVVVFATIFGCSHSASMAFIPTSAT